jgi:hypothetical protein
MRDLKIKKITSLLRFLKNLKNYLKSIDRRDFSLIKKRPIVDSWTILSKTFIKESKIRRFFYKPKMLSKVLI